MRYALLILTVFLLTGCATTSTAKINKVQYGMTQEEVLSICGEPISKDFDDQQSSWLYESMYKFSVIFGPQYRYHRVNFGNDNKVKSVMDVTAQKARNSAGSSNQGMGFLCKEAIANNDDMGVRTHCQ